MRFIAPHGLVTRPRTADDTEPFAALYASTRTAELAPVPWTDDAKRAFLRSQFDAQCRHYDLHYADAEFLAVEHAGRLIGRLILRWDDRDLRVVDISLLPEFRGLGFGTRLLRAVLAQATGSVSIHVERFNPALRLYQRLGFVHEADTGVYCRMRWKPEHSRSSDFGEEPRHGSKTVSETRS